MGKLRAKEGCSAWVFDPGAVLSRYATERRIREYDEEGGEIKICERR